MKRTDRIGKGGVWGAAGLCGGLLLLAGAGPSVAAGPGAPPVAVHRDAPRVVQTYFDVGRELVERGRVQDGLRAVAAAVALYPDDVVAQVYLVSLLDQDRHKDDVALHEAVGAVLPGYRPVLERLARLYEDQGHYRKAGILHLRAVGLRPDEAEARVRLERYYRFLGVSGSGEAEAGPDPSAPADPAPGAADVGSAPVKPLAPRQTISLEPLANMGDPLAMFVTGRQYLVDAANQGRADRQQRGLDYLARAAREGFTPAARFLGALYLAGEAVPPDPAKGIAYYERAAGADDVIAQKLLADMYFTGDRVGRNFSRAAYWYQTILDHPLPGQQAYKQADLWEIELRLGRLYLEGKGVERNPARARDYWERAARESRSPEAQRALAEALEYGIGGAVQQQNALTMYYAAAKGYLEHGYEHGLDPGASQSEATTILRAMERIGPEAGLTRQLRARLTGASVAP